MGKLVAALIVVWGVTACSPSVQTETDDLTASEQLGVTASAGPTEIPYADGINDPGETPRPLSVVPDELSDCKARVEATVTWDVREAHPGATKIQIWTGTSAKSALFAQGGSYGSKTTKAWTGPGTVFRLLDKDTGKELERIVVAGPTCGRSP